MLAYCLLRLFPGRAGNFQLAFILGIAPSLVMAPLFLPWLWRIIGSKPLVVLGKLSLGIYLLHFPVQCAMKDLELYAGLSIDYSSRLVWLTYAAVTLAAAALYQYGLRKGYEPWIVNMFRKKDGSSS